jgi:hypothetical protein
VISASELAAMRVTLNDTHTDTCTVLRPAALDQRRGRSAGLAHWSQRATPVEVTTVPCRTAPDFIPTAERVTGAAVAALRQWLVYVPVGTDVRPADLLRVTTAAGATATLEVTGVNAPRSIDLETTVRAQEVGAAPPAAPTVPLST